MNQTFWVSRLLVQACSTGKVAPWVSSGREMGNCCSGNHATADGPNEAAASDTALMEQTHQTAPVSIRSETTPTEEEPRVLEHIADREGEDGVVNMKVRKEGVNMKERR